MITEIAKSLVTIGLIFLLVGGLFWLSASTLRSFPIGRLPGDILIQKENFTVYFPLTTGLLLSLVLSAVLWLVQWLTDR
ncbi:DUF2905 domain-containing protein [Trichothermofontia sichuanensis B231]|uniref:DUF2905 domain-containing protein n=1 Tax=Trichothermofontia sichuanensis TaxID=3045816 RepID=UPI002246FFB5|nr:DUF2905 domain-containing protein [Trichothermofontia sichuanensis]UZQ53784.1 DUF2905 domain-containing protein [Trichothermofontia sichuanensis B231]